MLWVKSLHLIFVISWFAGLFYLPRLFVNLAMETDGVTITRLLLMAQKLYRFMNILVIPALVFGLWLWLGYDVGRGPGNSWLHVKLALVVVLLGYHHACGSLLNKCAHGRNTHSHRWYRWFNEIPALILVAIVLLVVVKPF